MTLVQLVAGDLESMPQLLQGAAVVAIVPATDLRGWAAEQAWQVARAAAGGGRRTALIDCFVNAPSLHTIAGAGNKEGLVDAFEYGASFNRIVQQQPQANLYFIPSGTFTANAEPLMQHPRWRRLSAGFRHEEALLLLYVGAEHLAGLAAEPDGLVVLAPRGLDLAVADAPALTEAVGRGMPVLAVVADEEAMSRATARAQEPAPRRQTPLPPSLPPEVTGSRAQDAQDRGRQQAAVGGGDRRQAAGVHSGQEDASRAASPPAAEPPRRRTSAPMMGLLIAEQKRKTNWMAPVGVLLGVAAVAAMVWYAVTQTR